MAGRVESTVSHLTQLSSYLVFLKEHCLHSMNAFVRSCTGRFGLLALTMCPLRTAVRRRRAFWRAFKSERTSKLMRCLRV